LREIHKLIELHKVTLMDQLTLFYQGKETKAIIL